ncbi:MAG: alternative ribosome rescue aminoacyl-tRNA hydrolase ArfB [Myxococcota bacterium]
MDLVIKAGVVLDGNHLSWHATRAGGPGGQHVNKVATKVDLRFDLNASTALSPAVKNRLRALARLDAEGRVVIISGGSRSQATNLEEARQKLRALVLSAMKTPKKRKATKPSKGAKRRRLESKRRQSQKKASRARVSYD